MERRTPEQIGQLILKTREAKGMSQTALGKKLGISQPAVSKIEAGKTLTPRSLTRIAQVLELPLDQIDLSLMDEREPAPTVPPIPTVEIAYGRRDFPVHGSAEGGPGIVIITSDPVDYIERPPDLTRAQDAYGILVTGTSMEPEYRRGDTAIVHPGLPTIADEVYIFYAEKEGEAKATIKHLRRHTPDKWFVTQHNPQPGESRDFTLSRREWQWAHRVIGKRRPR